ncbi:heparanase [Nomia melanderi]|uniref:heparanase n=1 Tax=Nomia melanderi TaxID=2448451 RepID=UPI00130435DE|nr:heparanase-like [Nomia melanderi]XP_031842933.1 heparanase-like [Nomia melanderi]XP_031842934.1 heparanase-like [Nomia melanderi]
MSYFIINERGKNQYENLGEVRTHTTLCPVFSLLILGFCMIFLILSAWNLNSAINETNTIHVYYLNLKRSPLHIVSKRFLSFGLDTSLLRDMKNLPIENEKFINLARHLAPAYVRVGGTSSDCLFFNQTIQISNEKLINPVDGEDISNFTITDVDFENLYNFSSKSKLRMIFDLNVLIRDANNSWNNTNAKNIISFAKEKHMKLDWQLGNEPNSFHHVFDRSVNATQLASDYYQLRELLNQQGYNDSILVGPEVNHIGDKNRMGENYTETFLKNDKDSVNYVTWHQYYLNGREAQIADFINVSTFNYLPMQIESVNQAIKASEKDILMWLSETSTAFGGGAPKLSDRFVAGFLWLDKLGYSASTGVNVVTRQSLFGGNYAMVGPDLKPNPDWWVSVVYKHFVSEKVLKLSSSKNNNGGVRFYAHCTPKKALINRVSAITIYGININEVPIRLTIHGILPILHKGAKLFVYALTSDNLQSRIIKMNGKILELQPNGNLPSFWPMILEPTQVIILPPYSMVFMVIHGAEVAACKT